MNCVARFNAMRGAMIREKRRLIYLASLVAGAAMVRGLRGFNRQQAAKAFNTSLIGQQQYYSSSFARRRIRRMKANGAKKIIYCFKIHGGARRARRVDTDAKLFKLDDHAEVYNALTEDCGLLLGIRLRAR